MVESIFGRVWARLGGTVCALSGALLTLAGCSGGGKVNEQLANPVALAGKQEAIALIRFLPPDPSCTALGMQIGVRQGDLYKPTQTLRLKELAVTNVMEVLLTPGHYHVLSLTCVRGKSLQTVWEPQGNGLLRRSYASFSVVAGEVVNVGEIRLIKVGSKAGVFRHVAEMTVEVGDWPLAELERFKSQRPQLYALMKTRLMTVERKPASAPGAAADQCEALRKLRAEGKVQALPAACAPS